MKIENAGVGSGCLEPFTVFYEGSVAPGFEGLTEKLPGDGVLSHQEVNGSILGAGNELIPFAMHYRTALAEDANAVLAERATVWNAEICYCSVLDQCWIDQLDHSPPFETDSFADEATILQPSLAKPPTVETQDPAAVEPD